MFRQDKSSRLWATKRLGDKPNEISAPDDGNEIIIPCWPYKSSQEDLALSVNKQELELPNENLTSIRAIRLAHESLPFALRYSEYKVNKPGYRIQRIVKIYTIVWCIAAACTITFSLHLYSQMWVIFKTLGALGLLLLPLLAWTKGPTHVCCNSSGIRLENRNTGAARSSSLIRWHDLSKIDLIKQPGGDPRRYTICFKDKLGSSLKIKLSVFATSENWKKLLSAIDAWSPVPASDDINETLFDSLLSNVKDPTYTNLWLEALSAPPRRERLTPLSEGSILNEGAYTLVRRLGAGGQGTAYLASTPNGEFVVLKEYILPIYVEAKVRRQAIEQFQHEAKMLSKLDHPLIVKLLDSFVSDHRAYLVLEFIDGQSLKCLIESKGSLPNGTVVKLSQMMCDILTYLHNQTPPVVHRDFTPDNLILDKDGSLKLIDFMIAKQSEDSVTATIIGKQSYFSPEQLQGKTSTQGDIYGLGATLYFLLTGQDPEPICSSHPILICDSVSSSIDDIVSKCTDPNLEKRYGSASEVKKDLERCRELKQ